MDTPMNLPCLPPLPPLSVLPACFARLVAARARRRPSAELQRQAACIGCCTRVPEEVWNALECAYPTLLLEGPGSRQAVALLMGPLMALQNWRFCRCYRGRLGSTDTRGLPEHRFIARLIDTVVANAAADGLITQGAS